VDIGQGHRGPQRKAFRTRLATDPDPSQGSMSIKNHRQLHRRRNGVSGRVLYNLLANAVGLLAAGGRPSSSAPAEPSTAGDPSPVDRFRSGHSRPTSRTKVFDWFESRSTLARGQSRRRPRPVAGAGSFCRAARRQGSPRRFGRPGKGARPSPCDLSRPIRRLIVTPRE